MMVMRDIFNTWVNESFNDFYLLTNHSGDMLVLQHAPETNNEAIWTMMVNTYGEPCEIAATSPDLTLGFGGNKSLTLTPFDNYFRNTENKEKIVWEN